MKKTKYLLKSPQKKEWWKMKIYLYFMNVDVLKNHIKLAKNNNKYVCCITSCISFHLIFHECKTFGQVLLCGQWKNHSYHSLQIPVDHMKISDHSLVDVDQFFGHWNNNWLKKSLKWFWQNVYADLKTPDS